MTFCDFFVLSKSKFKSKESLCVHIFFACAKWWCDVSMRKNYKKIHVKLSHPTIERRQQWWWKWWPQFRDLLGVFSMQIVIKFTLQLIKNKITFFFIISFLFDGEVSRVPSSFKSHSLQQLKAPVYNPRGSLLTPTVGCFLTNNGTITAQYFIEVPFWRHSEFRIIFFFLFLSK